MPQSVKTYDVSSKGEVTMQLPVNGSIVNFVAVGNSLKIVMQVIGTVTLANRTFFITENEEEVGLNFEYIASVEIQGGKIRTLWEKDTSELAAAVE